MDRIAARRIHRGDAVIGLVVGGCIAAVLFIAVFLLGPVGVRGEVRLGGGRWTVGQSCTGSGHSAPIREGARVMAIAYLGEPSGPESRLGPGRATQPNECRFPFSIDGIPRGAAGYELAVIDDSGIVAASRRLSERDLATFQEIDVPN